MKSAVLDAMFPDGHQCVFYFLSFLFFLFLGRLRPERSLVEEMHDDGLHGDVQAGDGEYAAVFTAAEVRVLECNC